MSFNFRRLLFTVPVLIILAFTMAACSGSSGSGTTVNVTLTDFKITSSLTTFKTGVAYHFVVKNDGAVPHQMLIMPPEPDTITAQKAVSDSLAGIGGDGMQPGTTQTFDYTFTKAYPAGQLEFACHLPGHYDSGMHKNINTFQ